MVIKTAIRHATIRYDDPELETTVVHGIGFRATCVCGWRSRVCGSYAMARGAVREHEKGHR